MYTLPNILLVMEKEKYMQIYQKKDPFNSKKSVCKSPEEESIQFYRLSMFTVLFCQASLKCSEPRTIKAIHFQCRLSLRKSMNHW